MKGAGQPRDLDFDPTEDAQTMSKFENGSGKEWFETRMDEKLASYDQRNLGFLKNGDVCL